MRMIGVLILGIGLSGASCLHAQRRETADIHLRNDCRLAAQVVQTGHPAPKFDWAISTLQLCDESGPPALAAAWRAAAPDTAVLGMLVYTSQRLRDQRIAAAVLEALQDASRPQIVRLSAIRLLISYAAPGRTASLGNLLNPGDPPILLPFITEFNPMDGAEPLAAEMREAVATALGTVADNDPDPVMRRAAAWVESRLPKR